MIKYAGGDYLDALGANAWTTRLPASAAVTTIEATLSATRESAVVIPAGTRVSPQDKIYFATDKDLIIPAGELTGQVTATCTETGESGNGYLPGEIATNVDPVPYVASVTNLTKSEGGAGIEEDASYREAIHIAPESFSNAGPIGAYQFYATHASALISDVAVSSPTPGVVDVRVLLEGGALPGEEMLQIVDDVLNDRSVRPLTDNVTVQAPTVSSYNVNLTYYIDTDDISQETAIRNNVQAAVTEFVTWTKSKIGRDINPSRLIQMVVAAGAKRVTVTSPAFTVLTPTQIGIAGTVTVQYGGTEDG